MIRQYTFSQLTATGSAGAAVGTVTSTFPIVGHVQAIRLDYGGTAATTDVTVATVHAPTITLLTATNGTTDTWYYPRVQLCDTNGSTPPLGGIMATVTPIPICDQVRVTVTQANDEDTVDVVVLYEE